MNRLRESGERDARWATTQLYLRSIGAHEVVGITTRREW